MSPHCEATSTSQQQPVEASVALLVGSSRMLLAGGGELAIFYSLSAILQDVQDHTNISGHSLDRPLSSPSPHSSFGSSSPIKNAMKMLNQRKPNFPESTFLAPSYLQSLSPHSSSLWKLVAENFLGLTPSSLFF
jgi:hypothetical protein